MQVPNRWAPNLDFHLFLMVEGSDKGDYYLAWCMGSQCWTDQWHLIIPASIMSRIAETGLTYLDGPINPQGHPENAQELNTVITPDSYAPLSRNYTNHFR